MDDLCLLCEHRWRECMEAAGLVPGSLSGLGNSINSLLACPAGYGIHFEPGSITVTYSRVPTLSFSTWVPKGAIA